MEPLSSHSMCPGPPCRYPIYQAYVFQGQREEHGDKRRHPAQCAAGGGRGRVAVGDAPGVGGQQHLREGRARANSCLADTACTSQSTPVDPPGVTGQGCAQSTERELGSAKQATNSVRQPGAETHLVAGKPERARRAIVSQRSREALVQAPHAPLRQRCLEDGPIPAACATALRHLNLRSAKGSANELRFQEGLGKAC